jgi:hypothetical protein
MDSIKLAIAIMLILIIIIIFTVVWLYLPQKNSSDHYLYELDGVKIVDRNTMSEKTKQLADLIHKTYILSEQNMCAELYKQLIIANKELERYITTKLPCGQIPDIFAQIPSTVEFTNSLKSGHSKMQQLREGVFDSKDPAPYGSPDAKITIERYQQELLKAETLLREIFAQIQKDVCVNGVLDVRLIQQFLINAYKRVCVDNSVLRQVAKQNIDQVAYSLTGIYEESLQAAKEGKKMPVLTESFTNPRFLCYDNAPGYSPEY